MPGRTYRRKSFQVPSRRFSSYNPFYPSHCTADAQPPFHLPNLDWGSLADEELSLRKAASQTIVCLAMLPGYTYLTSYYNFINQRRTLKNKSVILATISRSLKFNMKMTNVEIGSLRLSMSKPRVWEEKETLKNTFEV